ncbi:tyrosine-type recombinase/integrase [Brucella sp. 458]|uniref:tyrosine-type recombinase/integrase n=1 Tax=Brucella sp. 458 TaxID=2821140 RepID=UPI001FFC2FD2|nr:tyrosine-type recombinase/integrase [Brucella sp. 458]
MKVELVGVHKVKATRPNGDVVEYYYAWRGGPRMKSKPDTPAFMHEYLRLTRDRKIAEAKPKTLAWLVSEYLASADYQKLSVNTKRDYERMTGVISIKFGTLPVQALEARGARRLFMDWRDEMCATPRSADLHITVLARIMSWAKNREIIIRNPLEKAGKLHKSNRKDIIWMPSQLSKFLNEAPAHLSDVVKMALWTMQRKGDVLGLPTIAYSDGLLWITQGKTGARVRIKPADEILPILRTAKEKNRTRVLANSFGDMWTSSGFDSSFKKEMNRLEIKGVTFHDLRGTAITYAYANGMDVERIAEISGHSKSECETIIRRNYLAGGDVIEAIRKGTQ